MADIKLRVIPKPVEGTMPVMITDKGEGFIFVKGTGPDNLLCGSCGKTLLEKVGKGQIQGIVFKCPNCGAYNLT